MANKLKDIQTYTDSHNRLYANVQYDHHGLRVDLQFRGEYFDKNGDRRIEGKTFKTFTPEEVSQLAHFEKVPIDYVSSSDVPNHKEVALQPQDSKRNHSIPRYFAAAPVGPDYEPTAKHIDNMLEEAKAINEAQAQFKEKKKFNTRSLVDQVMQKADGLEQSAQEQQLET